MRTVRFTALFLVLAAATTGCVFPTDENPADGPVLGAFQSSGCKLESTLTTRSLIDGNMIEAVAYDTSVSIIHHDAQYQCNADITWELEVNGEELKLREVDSSLEVTRCICPVDLSVNVDNLTPGKKYHVQVWDEFETRMFGEVWVTVGNCDAQCTTGADCWNYPDLPRLDCAGDWACVNGLCNYYCTDTNPSCTSDADCAEGYQCVFYKVAADGTTNTDPATGVSSDAMVAYQCQTDADCPEGTTCQIAVCDCAPNTDCYCAEYGYCGGYVWPTEGVCEPIVINNECRTDADCGSGYHCEFSYPVATDSAGAAEADPMPPIEECYCTEEWAPVCGYDGVTYSNYCFAKCAGVGVAYEGECQTVQGIGYCVPDEDKGCYSDYDCPEGYVCQMTEWCAGVDQDGDGVIDPTWCLGQCVYSNVDPCEAQGGFCLPYDANANTVCPEGFSAADYSASGEKFCGGTGMCCIPVQQPECTTDDDCYNIYGAGTDPATGLATSWTCQDGYCVARTECGKMECYADSDCGDGYACVSTGYCDEAGNCCESTACQPVQQGCADDMPCAEGEVCENGVCVVIETPCAADADCKDGYACMDGVCQVVQQDCRQDDTGMCVCGGFAGFACPTGMECVYDDPNCSPDAGGADCMGHCYEPATPPDECVCDMMYAPVCGADGKTYSNKCMAACAGVEIVGEGECPVK